MNHPYILTDAEYQASIRKDNAKERLYGIAIALFIIVMICLQSGCDDQATQDEQNIATAFFPSKPSHAQQVAYQEEARADLILKQKIASR